MKVVEEVEEDDEEERKIWRWMTRRRSKCRMRSWRRKRTG